MSRLPISHPRRREGVRLTFCNVCRVTWRGCFTPVFTTTRVSKHRSNEKAVTETYVTERGCRVTTVQIMSAFDRGVGRGWKMIICWAGSSVENARPIWNGVKGRLFERLAAIRSVRTRIFAVGRSE